MGKLKYLGRGMNWRTVSLIYLLIIFVGGMRDCVMGAQIPQGDGNPSYKAVAVPSTVKIECSSEAMILSIMIEGNDFHGLVYPGGLSKNSSCLKEYRNESSPLVYTLPLRSCNTMPAELGNNEIEYYNSIVVQPHPKLVTNRSKGFHVRCRYQTRDKVVTNDQKHVSTLQSLALQGTAPMPGSIMKIFNGDPTRHHVAENVKIGDPLTLVITIEQQNTFGLIITNCIITDGLNSSEQRLINDQGCPVDGEIMGQFIYNENKTEAKVHFQAHKFPSTPSVYYRCNVQFCTKHNGGCSNTPPVCNDVNQRIKREASSGEKDPTNLDGGTPATIEVYSGLYVNEATDLLGKSDFSDDIFRERTIDEENLICIHQRSFAIGIAIAGLILMLAVVAAILVLLAKRRHKNISTTGSSSIYSGPNTAYSHSS